MAGNVVLNTGEYEYGNVFRNHIYDNAGGAYAALALSGYESGFNADRLNEMNCYFGIIDGKVTQNTDLNDDKIYVYRNFDGVPVPEGNQYYSKACIINKSTVFKTVNDSNFTDIFFDGYDDYIVEKDIRQTTYHDIQGIGYDIVGNKAYVYANDKFYDLTSRYEFGESYSNRNVNEIKKLNDAYKQVWDSGKFSINDYVKCDPISMRVPGANLYLELNNGIEVCVLSGDYVADLEPLHDTFEDMKNSADLFMDTLYVMPRADLRDYSTIEAFEPNPENKYYTFICFPNETKLSAKDHVHDYYAEAHKIVGVASAARLFLPVMSIIAFILACVCFVIFLIASGHVGQSEEIVAGPIDNMPIEVILFGEVVFGGFIINILDRVIPSRHLALNISAQVIGWILAMVMGLIFCSTVAVNVKLHRMNEKSLFLKLQNWKTRIWTAFLAIPMITVVVIYDFTMNGFGGAESLAVSCVVVMVVFAAFIFWGIRSYSKIKDSAEKLAAGDMTAHVDVRGMPQFMEETGTALNDIQAGIEIALAERTKSERMKTELITNVSHDIKTPITSIINYVDLLNKENLENENAKEYLEVLNRQSLRLKKLVEDLIEASKISTGNIELNMEKVNAEVLLDQSIGEFAERLKEKKIEVVVNSCEGEMTLMADNRYLWRVFDNIMSNIVKYAQADTRAYVNLEKEDNKLRFTFRNTSREQLNISPEELMERFVRGDKSRYTDGNGLGLSIAHSLTKSMGGTMNIFIDGDFFKVILEFDAITESDE
ncbi:MAG: HAMP domain-containing histidine kinase [Butyrivibrio sp.]|nr:HAMP domain-containing histidine kinase [Butyrivibrio sp.]